MIWSTSTKKKSETYTTTQRYDLKHGSFVEVQKCGVCRSNSQWSPEKSMKMFGILVDHHPHLHGLWKLGTPKSSKSSKSKGFSWFLLVSHHFFLLKLTFNEVFPHVQTQFFVSGGLQSANATSSFQDGRVDTETPKARRGARRHGNDVGWSQAKSRLFCQAMEPW